MEGHYCWWMYDISPTCQCCKSVSKLSYYLTSCGWWNRWFHICNSLVYNCPQIVHATVPAISFIVSFNLYNTID